MIELNQQVVPRAPDDFGAIIREHHESLMREEFIDIKQRLKDLSLKLDQREKVESIPTGISSGEHKPSIGSYPEHPKFENLDTSTPINQKGSEINVFDKEKIMVSKETQVSMERLPPFNEKFSKEDEYSCVNFETHERTSPESDKFQTHLQERNPNFAATPTYQNLSSGISPVKNTPQRSKVSNDPSSDYLKDTKNEDKSIDCCHDTPLRAQEQNPTPLMKEITEKLAEISSQLKELKNSDNIRPSNRVKTVKFMTPSDSEYLLSTAVGTKHYQLSEIEEAKTPAEEIDQASTKTLPYNDLLRLVESFSKQFAGKESRESKAKQLDESKLLLLSKFIEAFSGCIEPKKVAPVNREGRLAQRDME